MFTKIIVSPQKLQQRGTLSLPPACCSPSSYEGLTMLYLDGVDENGRQVKIYLFLLSAKHTCKSNVVRSSVSQLVSMT